MTGAIERLVKMKHGGFPVIHTYEDKTAKGLLRCIIEYIELTGGYSELQGFGDLYAIKRGKFVMIEIRINTEGERLPPTILQHLKRISLRIEKSGGVYIVAKSLEAFAKKWDRL